MAMPMVLHTLNLTADQKAQIHQIMKAQRPTLQPLFEQLRAGHQQLETELFSTGPVTMANLTPIEQNNAKIEEQIHQVFLQTALQIRGILTQSQISQGSVTLAKLQDLQSQMHTLMSPDTGDDQGPPPPDAE
jgi:Spy/CpxP family protein refolding chaperone